MSASRGACSTRGVMQPLFQNVAENSACKSRSPPCLPISRTEAKGCAWSTWTRWKRASGPPQMASRYQPTHIPKDRRLTRHGPTVGAITILKTKMVSRWKVPKGERRKRPGLSPGLFVWGASNGFVFARCRRSLGSGALHRSSSLYLRLRYRCANSTASAAGSLVLSELH